MNRFWLFRQGLLCPRFLLSGARVSRRRAPPRCSARAAGAAAFLPTQTLTAPRALINDSAALSAFCTAPGGTDVLPKPKDSPCLEDLSGQVPKAEWKWQRAEAAEPGAGAGLVRKPHTQQARLRASAPTAASPARGSEPGKKGHLRMIRAV